MPWRVRFGLGLAVKAGARGALAAGTKMRFCSLGFNGCKVPMLRTLPPQPGVA